MSEVKVNKISPRSGTTVTLGDSGDTFTIPSGATINNQGTATNFGATGSASWVTTVKTSTFTAVAGEGYFVNTTGGAVTVNLPAGTAGAVVAVKDYANTWDTNNCILSPNGSDKIGGDAIDATLSTEGLAVTLVFIDSTQGWLVTDDGLQSQAPTEQFVTATGGTETTCGNFKIHTFTGPGTFTVSCAGNASGSNSVEYLVVAGGGGGGAYVPSEPGAGGGGGAGGFRFASPSLAPVTYPAKPLAGSNVPVTAQGYPITVGAGGAGQSGSGDADSDPGSVSTFSSITSTGGGGTNNDGSPSNGAGKPGGSGGGAGGTGLSARCAGSGNTPSVTPPQGNDGGTYVGSGNTYYATAGGGGATAAGGTVNPHDSPTGGAGGAGGGLPTGFGSNGVPCGSFRYYAGGGGGGVYGGGSGGAGGLGGGAAGKVGPGTGNAGTANTGGGGGGQGNNAGGTGGAGGSGVVVIRYKFQ